MFGFFKKKSSISLPYSKISKEEYEKSCLLVDKFMAYNDAVSEGYCHEEHAEAKRNYMNYGISVEITWGKSSQKAREVWWSKDGERFFWGYE